MNYVFIQYDTKLKYGKGNIPEHEDLPTLGDEVQIFFNQPPRNSMSKTYIFVENIEIWVTTTIYTKYRYMHIKHLETCMKGTISLQNLLSHLESLNAHIREHIQDKDHDNIKHVHHQRQHQPKNISIFHIS